MSNWRQHTWHSLRFCGECLGLLGCWILWLVLAAALALQVAVIVSKEFTVPAFVLRSLEERFTAAGVTARFGRATFDASGDVLLENMQLSMPQFAEPIAQARAVFIEIDPWSLFAGRVEPRRVHVTGATLFVPAMLAPSGRSEETLQDLDGALSPDDHSLGIDYLNARVAGVAVSLRGTWELPPRAEARPTAAPAFLERIVGNYADFSRQLVRAGEWLNRFEQPQLQLTLSPSPNRGIVAEAALIARGFEDEARHGLKAQGLRLVTRAPLRENTPSLAPLELSIDELHLAGGLARGVHAQVRGTLDLSQPAFTAREVLLTADLVTARGFSLETLALRAEPGPLPALTAGLVARNFGSPLAVTGQADLSRQRATLQVDGAISPQVLNPIGAILRRDIRRFIDFGQPVGFRGSVDFQPGWRFGHLAGRIAARDINAYHVHMDTAQGAIEFDGRRFFAHDAIARIADNFGRGSFEQDLKTREFRFLLEGRLRPLAIGGWFREWWPDFFEHFEFPDAPPSASVDVAGRWFAGHETTVFVFAESSGPSIRGAQLDYARTLMFIRPNFFDGLELFGIRGVGDVRGTFTRTMETQRYSWKELTLALESTLDLETGAKLLGPALAPTLEPYQFERAPHLKVTGRFAGPAAETGEHRNLSIKAESTGAFVAFGFPGRNLSFDAALQDDDLTLENISADVAAGILTGRAKLWGGETDRRLGFDASLRGASLGQAATAVSQFLARRRGDSGPATTDAILTGQNSTSFDVSVSAEGAFEDPLSYRGSGNASFAGPELGKIRLLGLLSELVNFTALRFTNAQADFKVEGPQVTFRSVTVTGANSAIQAHGNYSIRHDQLDFNARLYPFQESDSLVQNFVGVMLLPFSAVLEVRLSGPLREPNWAFVIGPTNLFRSLGNTPETSSPAAGADYLTRPSPPPPETR